MPTDRPCDVLVVPDVCADNGGLVSVQLDITVTASGLSLDWGRKNAVVFFSRRDEVTSSARNDEQKYIQKQSDLISTNFRECLTGQVDPILSQSGSLASTVSLTQAADCVSAAIAARLGAPPRGIFISPKNKRQLASISGYFAECQKSFSLCVDAAQSFAEGHVIAHDQIRYQHRFPIGTKSNGVYVPRNTLFFAVLLAPRTPPGPGPGSAVSAAG